MSVTPARRKLLIHRQAEPPQLCPGIRNKDFPYLTGKGHLSLSCPKQENPATKCFPLFFSGGLLVSEAVLRCVVRQEYFVGFLCKYL